MFAVELYLLVIPFRLRISSAMTKLQVRNDCLLIRHGFFLVARIDFYGVVSLHVKVLPLFVNSLPHVLAATAGLASTLSM